MTIMKKVLDAMEMNEAITLKDIISAIEKKHDEVFNHNQRSGARNCVLLLFQKDFVTKEEIGGYYWYTLIRDKSEYKHLVVNESKRKIYRKPPVFNVVEWYSLRTLGHVEQMTKELNISIPKTKDDIINFYNLYKQAI